MAHPATPRRTQSSSRSGKQDLIGCAEILRQLRRHEDAAAFLLPVDTKSVDDYLQYVKEPMDLDTVHKRLEGLEYSSKDDFAADVRLIFNNCKA